MNKKVFIDKQGNIVTIKSNTPSPEAISDFNKLLAKYYHKYYGEFIKST
jgi:hypothetical protein